MEAQFDPRILLADLRRRHPEEADVLDRLEAALGLGGYREPAAEALARSRPVCRPVPEWSLDLDPGGPEHLLLEGENLYSLAWLTDAWRGRVNVIYIDPPYNRGRGGTYCDTFARPEDPDRHGRWLAFLERRLRLARQLLSPDGLIFLSIDDNEAARLRVLCDGIFGEEQFINCFIWKRNSSIKTERGKFPVNTEYVLLYAGGPGARLHPAFRPLSPSSRRLYSRDDGDGRGRYQTVSLQKPRDPGPETTYDYVDNLGRVWKCPPKGWRMRYDKLKALENDRRLVLTGSSLRMKDYWNERASTGRKIDTLWDDLPENSAASKELQRLLGRPAAFDSPKPVALVRRCLEIAGPDALVLDFFAGSGTTGQAVLELNRDDGGRRRFILCTNDENGICTQVTVPRLQTVITGRRPDGSAYGAGIPANLRGYRVTVDGSVPPADHKQP